MTHNEFKFWMSGYLTLATEDFMDLKQLMTIKNHINLVKSVDGFLDLNMAQLLTLVECSIKSGTVIFLSDLKETWARPPLFLAANN